MRQLDNISNAVGNPEVMINDCKDSAVEFII